MPSLFSAADRETLLARLTRLTPNATARWGRMTAPKMLAHLNDAFRMGLGELPIKKRKLPFVLSALRAWPVKQLVIYAMPFPKSAPTAPEIYARDTADWNTEMQALLKYIAMAGVAPSDYPWAEHPLFGTLSHKTWGVLGYKHIDHHLQQFGV